MGKRSNRIKGRRHRHEKPGISACLIVRDEEKNLHRCLHSVISMADEIIVVDTGSTDRTVAIAESYGAKVYHHPWEDHFSKHRNQAISHATGAWIFTIDADEEFVAEDAQKLREAIQDKSVDAVMVQVVSQLRGGRSEGVHCVERIFRNNGVIHYEGRVHNRLVGIKKAIISTARILHYGYDLDPEASEAKFRRTVSLLKRDLEDDPANPMTYHYLGCSYLSQGMFAKCLESSRKAIDLAASKMDSNLIYIWSHYNAAMSAYKLKDLAQAESLCIDALTKCPTHIDSHFVLCLVHFDHKQWKKVISSGSEYMRLAELQEREPEAFGNLVTCTLKERWNIASLMGMAYVQVDQSEKSEEAFNNAIRMAPQPFLVARAAGIFLYNQGLYHQSRTYLEKAMELGGSDETIHPLLEEIEAKTGGSQRDPSISCCMIVKNEEAFLAQCLKSIRDFVDEIVVVDTGSTDGTVEIAKRFTDKVYFHPWEGSFSKARNQALTYATGDWIFIIDGDEELLPGAGEKLRDAVRNAGDADAFHVNTISIYSSGNKRARHNSERLFRNNGMIHYEGIVHNRVVGARSVKASRIEVMHYGYNLEEKKAHEKFLRTSELLKKQIEEDPDDPMPHHYLGTSYLSRGMNEEAAKESMIAVELAKRKKDPHPLYTWAHHNAAIAFFRMGELEKAREYSLRALERDPRHLDSYYTLTMVAAERGQWNDVISYGSKHLELLSFFEENPDQAGLVINSTLNEGPSIHLLIGHAYHALGQLSKMEEHYSKAESQTDEKWQAWWNAGCFHLDRSGDLELAEIHLNRALELSPEQHEAWYMLAKLSNKTGRFEEEKRRLLHLLQMGSRDTVVLHRLAALCISFRELDNASLAVNALLQAGTCDFQELVDLASAYQSEGRLEKALHYFDRAVQADPSNISVWSALGELSLRLGQHEEARTFLNTALTLNPGSVFPMLLLCDVEIRHGDMVSFIHLCDRIMMQLGLSRNRTLSGIGDVLALLHEIHAAIEDKVAARQALRLIELLQNDSRWQGVTEVS